MVKSFKSYLEQLEVIETQKLKKAIKSCKKSFETREIVNQYTDKFSQVQRAKIPNFRQQLEFLRLFNS